VGFDRGVDVRVRAHRARQLPHRHYLPGRADQQYRINSAKMLHDGLEGNWFRATRAWDDFVKPFIPKTPRPNPAAQQQ
jgi:hypothetical protein